MQARYFLIGSVAVVCTFALAQSTEVEEGRREYPLTYQGAPAGAKAVYTGDLVDGKRHGRGRMVFGTPAGEEAYIGEWSDDRKHGVGTLKTPLFTYQGQFQNDLQHGRGVQMFATGDRFEGGWVSGKRQGSGIYRWANGAVAEGDWSEDARNGFSLSTARDGAVTAEFYVKNTRVMASPDLRALAEHPAGCNGQFDDWVVLKGICSKQGLQKDKGAIAPELIHHETLDQHHVDSKRGVLTLFRQGVVIEGPLRGPFDFVSATIKRPVLGADGKSISWVQEYSGPMHGLVMHGNGKCALPAGGMEDCAMEEGQRVTVALTQAVTPSAPANPMPTGSPGGVAIGQPAYVPDKETSAKNFGAFLTACDKQDAASCVAAARQILGNEVLLEVTEPDARTRLGLDVLDKAVALGSVDAMGMEFDIFEVAKLPSPIAFLSIQRSVVLMAELEKSGEDSAKIRVAYQNLTSIDPFKAVLGALDGSMKKHCNAIRLMKAKGSLRGIESGYAEKGLATAYCAP